MEGIKSTLREDLCVFMIIYSLILLRMRNLAEKRHKIKIYALCSVTFVSKIMPFK